MTIGLFDRYFQLLAGRLPAAEYGVIADPGRDHDDVHVRPDVRAVPVGHRVLPLLPRLRGRDRRHSGGRSRGVTSPLAALHRRKRRTDLIRFPANNFRGVSGDRLPEVKSNSQAARTSEWPPGRLAA